MNWRSFYGEKYEVLWSHATTFAFIIFLLTQLDLPFSFLFYFIFLLLRLSCEERLFHRVFWAPKKKTHTPQWEGLYWFKLTLKIPLVFSFFFVLLSIAVKFTTNSFVDCRVMKWKGFQYFICVFHVRRMLLSWERIQKKTLLFYYLWGE